MKRRFEAKPSPNDAALQPILGVGVPSVRKNYYPQLRARVAELERFRALFDHGNDLILLAHTASGAICDVNIPMCKQLGYAREQLLGLSLAKVLPPGTVDDVLRLSEGQTLRVETVLMAADDDQFVVEMTARVAVEPQGTCALMVFRDMHRQLLANAELCAARERAERANLSKSRFLAAASHDLRQPFQAMTLFQELLSARLQDPYNKAVLERLQQSIKSGHDLLNALLDVSTLDAGIIQPKPGRVDLGELILSMHSEFAVQLGERRKVLKLVHTCAAVLTDITLLSRMVRNLIINALKYTGENGKVLVGCRRNAGGVRLMVVDNGPGIPAEKHEEIFEEFTQLHNLERDRRNGLGLGLAIVTRMARLLGVTVGVRSTLGRGACFYIDFPADSVLD